MTGDASLSHLQRQFQRLFGDRLLIEVGADPTTTALSAAEQRETLEWTPHRRTQFAMGRTLARRALERLGKQTQDILYDADGVPIWPVGVVGSISHKKWNCIVLAASAKYFKGLGVDLELNAIERAKDEDEIVNRVCITPNERSQALAMKAICWSPGSVFFAAKEAFFKLQFPITRTWLEWHEVEVSFGAGLSFSVKSRANVSSKRIQGFVKIHADWIVALACLAQQKPKKVKTKHKESV